MPFAIGRAYRMRYARVLGNPLKAHRSPPFLIMNTLRELPVVEGMIDEVRMLTHLARPELSRTDVLDCISRLPLPRHVPCGSHAHAPGAALWA